MRKQLGKLIWLVGLAALPATAHGRTWIVELDGSGDFTVIQDAVDAAMDGDVIFIGPGRFNVFHTVYNGSTPLYDVYVAVDNKSLSLVGAGAEQTIIGSIDGSGHTRQTFGIRGDNCSTFNISKITVENTNYELLRFQYGQLIADDCVFRSGNFGIFAIASGGGVVENCRFFDLAYNGVVVYTPSPQVRISDCQFENVHVGVGAYWSGARCEVDQCSFVDCFVGANYSDLSTGIVQDCSFTNCENYGISISDPLEVLIADNHIVCGSGAAGIGLLGSESLTVINNIIEGGNYASIYVDSGYGELDFHQNHIFRMDGGYFARTTTYFPPPNITLDLSGNYWGTTDLDEIETWTLDGNDLPNSHLFFNFEPIADGPVETQQTTWGAVKSLFMPTGK